MIPALVILTGLLGLTGIQIAQPVADVASLCLMVPLIARFLRNMGKLRVLIRPVTDTISESDIILS